MNQYITDFSSKELEGTVFVNEIFNWADKNIGHSNYRYDYLAVNILYLVGLYVNENFVCKYVLDEIKNCIVLYKKQKEKDSKVLDEVLSKIESINIFEFEFFST